MAGVLRSRAAALAVVAVLALAVTVTVLAVEVTLDGHNPEAEQHLLNRDRCTALLVGKKASVDGSVMTTHNNDCTDCDFRLTRVPAADYPKGEKRPVYGVRFGYPRYVGKSRGDFFLASNTDKSILDWQPDQPIGYIPQVEHTYSYLDGSYAIINEKQVAIGESTCDARLVARPIHGGGAALFDVGELARVALERASTAREAIQIMGDLGYEYGYYGSEWEGAGAMDEAGEAITVTDPNEAWHFHILPDDTGRRAIWAAARVPDHHVSSVTNYFVIRKLDLSKPSHYMASPNVFDVARRLGFWDGVSEFDFAKTYSCQTPASMQHFSHRYAWMDVHRTWSIAEHWAPSMNASAETWTHHDYPFSFKPDKLLSVNDVMAMTRDYFTGTKFDLTRGIAAGPWGSPSRYDGTTRWMEGVTFERLMEGHFERAISIHRTIYSYVTQCRDWLPDTIGARLWFAPHQPHTSTFVPFYVAGEVAPAFETGHLYYFDRQSAWWAFSSVANWAEKAYMWISQDILAKSGEIESRSLVAAVKVEAEALEQWKQGNGHHGAGAEAAAKTVSNWAYKNANQIAKEWWSLFETLLAKYRDGQRVDCPHAKNFFSQSLFYPETWLKAVGYWPAGHEPKAESGSPVPESGSVAVESDPRDTPYTRPVPGATPSVAGPTLAAVPTVVPAPQVTPGRPMAGIAAAAIDTLPNAATSDVAAASSAPAQSHAQLVGGFAAGVVCTLALGAVASWMRKHSGQGEYQLIA